MHLGDLPTFPSASVSDTGYRTVNSPSDENAITCDHYEMEEQSGGRGNAIFRAEREIANNARGDEKHRTHIA